MSTTSKFYSLSRGNPDSDSGRTDNRELRMLADQVSDLLNVFVTQDSTQEIIIAVGSLG